jgi:hypothetical protein
MDDYLPLGSELLPMEFQLLLFTWNKTIAEKTGSPCPCCNGAFGNSWQGLARKNFKLLYPEEWEAFNSECKRLSRLYKKELDALKEYQKTHLENLPDDQEMITHIPLAEQQQEQPPLAEEEQEQSPLAEHEQEQEQEQDQEQEQSPLAETAACTCVTCVPYYGPE